MSKIKELLEQEQVNDSTCPRCAFARALYQYNAFGVQDETVYCWRCGYSSYSGIKLDQDLSFVRWEHSISAPAGLLVVGAKHTNLNSDEQILEKVAWLRAEIAAGKTKGEDAYLTRWNRGTGQVELLVGKHPWEP